MKRRDLLLQLSQLAIPASLCRPSLAAVLPFGGKVTRNDLLTAPSFEHGGRDIQIKALSQFPKPSIEKVKYFSHTFADDIHLNVLQAKTAVSIHTKLKTTIRQVGYGNFNVISLDDAISCNNRLGNLAQFSRTDLNFIEELFGFDARYYGFFGDKVISELSTSFNRRKINKVPGSGHFLLDGDATAAYGKIRKEIGPTIYLTSGVRGVVKQLYLFLNKLIAVEGNLSRASRSLAPPGYSFHGIGDFDVGKKGLGSANFTSKFARTTEYQRLIELGHIQIRYPEENSLGVRYEPWHIKVV